MDSLPQPPAPAPLSPSLWTCLVTGCFVWPGLFVVFWAALLRWYPDRLACGTAMRLVSIIHAIVQVIGGFTVFYTTYDDIFFMENRLLEQCMVFTTVYWVYDVAAMFLAYQREKKGRVGAATEGVGAPTLAQSVRTFLRENPLICVHHLLILFGGMPVILHYRRGKGAGMFAVVQLSELSTPFLNFRKILIRHGWGGGKLFKLNNAVAIASFFCARLVFFPSIYLIYANCYQLPLREVVESMYPGCHIVMVGVTALQAAWFIIFVRTLWAKRKTASAVWENGKENGLHDDQRNGNGHCGQSGGQNGYSKQTQIKAD